MKKMIIVQKSSSGFNDTKVIARETRKGDHKAARITNKLDLGFEKAPNKVPAFGNASDATASAANALK